MSKMASTNKNKNICQQPTGESTRKSHLSACAAQKLRTMRADGERLNHWMRENLRPDEVVLFQHDHYFFTNFGRLVKYTREDIQLVSPSFGFNIGTNACWFPEELAEQIMRKRATNEDTLINLIVAATAINLTDKTNKAENTQKRKRAD